MKKRLPTQYHKFCLLNVSFRATKDFQKTDKDIIKILGMKPTGSGLHIPTKTRDLSFRFEKETEAEKAKKRLEKSGFNSIVCTCERDTP